MTVTRKIRRPLAPELAVALMDEYRYFPTVPTDYPLIVSAVELSLRYGMSYWDGAIVAAAEALAAPILYTEDLGHLQRYGSVRAPSTRFSLPDAAPWRIEPADVGWPPEPGGAGT